MNEEIPRVLISTPVHAAYTQQFRDSLGATLKHYGHSRMRFDELLCISHVELARNTLVGRFIHRKDFDGAGFDVMLGIDADMSWTIADVQAVLAPIISGRAELVSGVYYRKVDPLMAVVEFTDDDVDEQRGFVGERFEEGDFRYCRIGACGGGFLAMTRRAIEETMKTVPSYCPAGPLSITKTFTERHPLLFRSGIHELEMQPGVPRFYGEDYGGCYAFRQAGFEMYAALDSIPLHWAGTRSFGGMRIDLNLTAKKQALTANISREHSRGETLTDADVQRRFAALSPSAAEQ